MKRNIIVAKKALSPEVCNKIIEIAKPNFVPAKIGDLKSSPDLERNIRESHVSWFDKPFKYIDIMHPIQKMICDINFKFYGFDLWGHEPFQITKYDEKNKGKYDPHVDGAYDDPSNKIVRKLSVSIQLTSSEYYEGGNLVFPDDKNNFNIDDSREQGTAIFFPSYVKHGVEPVTKGIRFSLVCWSNGPNFY
tara:strand:- start:4002 stop:4574 length:573 start_codon:yes stop_codon:yes gene_type:complete